VLHSQAFFSDANIGTRVIGPVEYVVGSARMLEPFDHPPSTLLLADWAARLGQELFHPPNVGGWAGGRNWIGTQTIIGRANYAAALLESGLSRDQEPLDALALAMRHGRGDDLDTLITFYAELVLGAEPDLTSHNRIMAALGPKPRATPENARRVATIILALPEAQLA
jgi:Protein of unknown function (DUF1800)